MLGMLLMTIHQPDQPYDERDISDRDACDLCDGDRTDENGNPCLLCGGSGRSRRALWRLDVIAQGGDEG